MTKKRSFGIAARNFTAYPEMPDARALVDYGVRVEELGYDSVFVWDHILLGVEPNFPIIDSLTTEWDPSQYRDTYADELRKMIDEKAKHGTISAEDHEPATPSNVTDLMAALEASVKSAKKPRRERSTKSA